MRPPEEVKKEIVRQWLAKAEQDLQASEVLLSAARPFPYPACFHAQQTAEKCLKAALTWHQVEFRKTHAIEELLDLVALADQDLATSLKDAAGLTPYGVDIRYPGDAPEPDMDEARRAVELAR
ncbi:MAG: HEPN domain-containing protein, partial [Pseudomonadota bacterium]